MLRASILTAGVWLGFLAASWAIATVFPATLALASPRGFCAKAGAATTTAAARSARRFSMQESSMRMSEPRS